jgi:hypothetical protein
MVKFNINIDNDSHDDFSYFYLDEIQIAVVQTADTEAGTITAPLLMADGRPAFDFERDLYAIVERRGNVEIRSPGSAKLSLVDAYKQERYPFRVEDACPGELSPGWNDLAKQFKEKSEED